MLSRSAPPPMHMWVVVAHASGTAPALRQILIPPCRHWRVFLAQEAAHAAAQGTSTHGPRSQQAA